MRRSLFCFHILTSRSRGNSQRLRENSVFMSQTLQCSINGVIVIDRFIDLVVEWVVLQSDSDIQQSGLRV